MTRATRLALIAIVTLASAGCDQTTKHIARVTLDAPGSVSLLHDTVRFRLAENRGAFLSLGRDLPAPARRFVFVGVAAMLLAGLALTAVFGSGLGAVQIAGLALVLGGGLGNLIDRVLRDGLVTDFVQIGLGPLRTGIFNLSDLAILLGVACFAFARESQPPSRGEA